MKKFLEKTVALTPAERATALEQDQSLASVHESHASTGQTATPDLADEVNLHFVCLVERDGHLYELDGNKPYPINHGISSKDTFLTVSSFLSSPISQKRY
jgi:ubiquitin carboxyl-terminal hydrolase L3